MKSRIVFAALAAVAVGHVLTAEGFPGANPDKANGPAPARQGSAAAPVASVGKIEKAKAADARTVAEVVSGKSGLNGQTVTIRGKVVKASRGILGKNWIHLQDGTGSASAATHDIVVTTVDAVEVGDVVNANGIVRTDVDIGSGYKYAVLVEGAKLRK
jgi:hypothetical protein